MFPIEYIVTDEKNGLIRCGDSELTVDFRPPVCIDSNRDLQPRFTNSVIYLKFEDDIVKTSVSVCKTIVEAMKELDLRDMFDRVVRDKTKRPISVGDYIVYPTVSASSGFLKFGRVIELRHAIDNKGRDKLVVIAEDDSYENTGWLQKKPSTLHHPSRTLVITMNSLPREIFEKMEEYYIGPPKIRKKKKW